MEKAYSMAAKIKEILKLKLDEFIVDSIIRVSCQRMGIEPENLDDFCLNEFIEKIKYSILLFLSSAETEELIQKIKTIKEKNNVQS